jgi:hypothetical protein
VIPIAFSSATPAGAPVQRRVAQAGNTIPHAFSTLFQKAQTSSTADNPETAEPKPFSARKSTVSQSKGIQKPDATAVPVQAVPDQLPKPILLHLSFSFGVDQAQDGLPADQPAGNIETPGNFDAVPQQVPSRSVVAFSMNLQEFGVPIQKPGEPDRQNSNEPRLPPFSGSYPTPVPQTGESSAPNSDSGHAGTEEDKPADLKKEPAEPPLQSPAPAAHMDIQTSPGSANAALHPPAGVEPQTTQAWGKPIAEARPVIPTVPHLPAAPPSPRHIDLTVPNDDGHQVDVRISQRGGEIQVTVRTPDGALAQSLRHHLPELSENLSRTGRRGEFFPAAQSQSSGEGERGETSHHSPQHQSEQNQAEQNDRTASGDRTKDKDPGSFAEMIHAEKRNKN